MDSNYYDEDLVSAMQALRNAIGSADVIVDRPDLRAAEKATFQTEFSMLAVKHLPREPSTSLTAI
jgi:hypothetical protein